jgi:hypothetical protein
VVTAPLDRLVAGTAEAACEADGATVVAVVAAVVAEVVAAGAAVVAAVVSCTARPVVMAAKAPTLTASVVDRARTAGWGRRGLLFMDDHGPPLR